MDGRLRRGERGRWWEPPVQTSAIVMCESLWKLNRWNATDRTYRLSPTCSALPRTSYCISPSRPRYSHSSTSTSSSSSSTPFWLERGPVDGDSGLRCFRHRKNFGIENVFHFPCLPYARKKSFLAFFLSFFLFLISFFFPTTSFLSLSFRS